MNDINITEEMMFYTTNKDWYYFDPRYMRDRLTDQATKKAVKSYIDLYSSDITENENKIIDRTIKDLEEYSQYKNRYKFKKDKDGTNILESIDGKPIIPLSKVFQ